MKWRRVLVWFGLAAAAAVVVAAGVYVVFWPVSDLIARHDVGAITGPRRGAALQAARDAARGRLLTFGAGLFAAGALVYTGRNFTLSRRAVELTRTTVEITEQGQVTDRYTKAIDQLGSNKLDVRLGGIYALERVARDSPRDHPTVMEVLAAFTREHSHDHPPPPQYSSLQPSRDIRPDVQAAVTVIGRRDTRYDGQPVNLYQVTLIGAKLAGADLNGADLTGAKLARADLTGAKLSTADLTGADLTGADLTGADLTGADLTGADLTDADLTRAKLPGGLTGVKLVGAKFCDTDLADTDLTGAQLARADFTRADLTRANLPHATLSDAILASANLTDADLTRADLLSADLTNAKLPGAILADADLTGALWPRVAVVPKGWQQDPNSGRLKRADAPGAARH